MIFADCGTKVHEVAETVDVLYRMVFNILYCTLGMRKLSALMGGVIADSGQQEDMGVNVKAVFGHFSVKFARVVALSCHYR